MNKRFVTHLDLLRRVEPASWIEVLEGEGGDVEAFISTFNCVVTNGCFDILHPGHLKLLESVSAIAEAFDYWPIIALNSDESIRKIKGATRPIVPQNSRAKLLTSLEKPFTVIIFDEETPQRVMDLLRPKFVVKGLDYAASDVVRWKDSNVISVPLEDGWSTTSILERNR